MTDEPMMAVLAAEWPDMTQCLVAVGDAVKLAVHRMRGPVHTTLAQSTRRLHQLLRATVTRTRQLAPQELGSLCLLIFGSAWLLVSSKRARAERSALQRQLSAQRGSTNMSCNRLDTAPATADSVVAIAESVLSRGPWSSSIPGAPSEAPPPNLPPNLPPPPEFFYGWTPRATPPVVAAPLVAVPLGTAADGAAIPTVRWSAEELAESVRGERARDAEESQRLGGLKEEGLKEGLKEKGLMKKGLMKKGLVEGGTHSDNRADNATEEKSLVGRARARQDWQLSKSVSVRVVKMSSMRLS